METTFEELKESVEAMEEEVIGWRRHLHRNPETSFNEVETAQFVYETLDAFGGLELSRPTSTSVVARLTGTASGPAPAAEKVIALRADMDALPITEDSGLEFASRNAGVMHACGHDGHTAMLLGTAKIISEMRDRLPGEIRFIFQHAEELVPGGAEEMVEAGVMDGVDAVIGIHLWAPLEVGKIGVVYGPMMASPDTFKITVEGQGGHAAMPHTAVDSIAIGAQVVNNLQHVVSRETDPLDNAVLSVTKFSGGTTHNVIPGTVEMIGTVRTLDSGLRARVPEIMERVMKGITQAHGASYQFEYQLGYRPVVNDEGLTRLVEETARDVFGEAEVELMPTNMGGEDFSGLQQKAPGCFVLVGAGNEEEGITYPHHHPRFTVDEAALSNGLMLFTSFVLKWLSEEGRD